MHGNRWVNDCIGANQAAGLGWAYVNTVTVVSGEDFIDPTPTLPLPKLVVRYRGALHKKLNDMPGGCL